MSDIETTTYGLLANEPSPFYEVEGFKVKFQRPSLPVKFKGRGWYTRKLKEYDIPSDSEMGTYFDIYATLNYFTIAIIDPKGNEVTLDKGDYDKSYPLEKAVEMVYNSGKSEDGFISSLYTKLLDWTLETGLQGKEDDIKNS